MKTLTVFGRKAEFCHEGCRDAFREDRKARIIYPAVLVDGKLTAWEDASRITHTCAYCNGHN